MKHALDLIVTSNELWDAIEHADTQTQDLSLDVLRELQKRLKVEQSTLNALHRLLGLLKQGKDWSPDLIRNNVFKVAHELGLDLPSSSF